MKEYIVHILDFNDGSVIAELKTTSRAIAYDFIYDGISRAWHAEDQKVGLFDPDYGYYAIAIPHTENSLFAAFEIMRLSSEDMEPEFYCIPDAIDIMEGELE